MHASCYVSCEAITSCDVINHATAFEQLLATIHNVRLVKDKTILIILVPESGVSSAVVLHFELCATVRTYERVSHTDGAVYMSHNQSKQRCTYLSDLQALPERGRQDEVLL
jgi:hypothetical protein